MPLDLVAIRAECAKHPMYEPGTAYERTKICCQVLTEKAEPIPSWIAIRELIGKGSSTDINRGVKDFRREHAEVLKQMQGVTPGVPEVLAPYIRGLWEAAIGAARSEFAANVTWWEEQLEQATAQADEAMQKLSEAKASLDSLQEQLATSQSHGVSLERQVETLQQAVRRSEDEQRTFPAQNENLVRQKSVLDATVTKLDTDLRQLRDQLAAAERDRALLQQETHSLRERLGRAETQADRLAQDNRTMVELLKSARDGGTGDPTPDISA